MRGNPQTFLWLILAQTLRLWKLQNNHFSKLMFQRPAVLSSGIPEVRRRRSQRTSLLQKKMVIEGVSIYIQLLTSEEARNCGILGWDAVLADSKCFRSDIAERKIGEFWANWRHNRVMSRRHKTQTPSTPSNPTPGPSAKAVRIHHHHNTVQRNSKCRCFQKEAYWYPGFCRATVKEIFDDWWVLLPGCWCSSSTKIHNSNPLGAHSRCWQRTNREGHFLRSCVPMQHHQKSGRNKRRVWILLEIQP